MPYGNQSATTGSRNAVRRVNTPYDMGALDARELLVMRGRLGAVRTMQQTTHCEAAPVMPHGIAPVTHRYPDMQMLNRVPRVGFSRTPFSPGADGVRALLLMRGRLGQPVPLLTSSRYASRAGAGSRTYGPIAGRYAANGGRRLGQVAEIATAATSLAPAIVSIAQLFGGGLSGANAERAAKVYTYYENAMTAPGSTSSIDAATTLWAIANQAVDPIQHLQENNPQATRAYAQQALQQLSSQGWVDLNSGNPRYIGIGASGRVFAPNAQGVQQAVADSGIPPTGTYGPSQSPNYYGGGAAISPLVLLGVLGLGAVLLLRNR
jgi:hypothetical protein